jgi:hypothetical protein
MAVLDLRARCERKNCNKLIRKGEAAQREFARYRPYCSYHCQEWGRLEGAMQHLRRLKGEAAC